MQSVISYECVVQHSCVAPRTHARTQLGQRVSNNARPGRARKSHLASRHSCMRHWFGVGPSPGVMHYMQSRQDFLRIVELTVLRERGQIYCRKSCYTRPTPLSSSKAKRKEWEGDPGGSGFPPPIHSFDGSRLLLYCFHPFHRGCTKKISRRV